MATPSIMGTIGVDGVMAQSAYGAWSCKCSGGGPGYAIGAMFAILAALPQLIIMKETGGSGLRRQWLGRVSEFGNPPLVVAPYTLVW